MNYLVKNTGRVGSHIIMNYLSSCGLQKTNIDFVNVYYDLPDQPKILDDYKKIFTPHNEVLTPEYDNWAIHDHSGWLPPNIENYNAIIVIRKNKAKQIASHYLAMRTQMYVKYERPTIEPFLIDIPEAMRMYDTILQIEERLLAQANFGWNSFNVIHLETLLEQNFTEYLNNITGLTCNNFEIDTYKNPNSASDYIINYNELVESIEQGKIITLGHTADLAIMDKALNAFLKSIDHYEDCYYRSRSRS